MNQNNKGFIKILVGVIIVVVIGVVGYFALSKKSETPSTTQSPPILTNNPSATSTPGKIVPPQKILKVAIGLIPKQFSPDFYPKVSADGSRIVFQKSGAEAGGGEGKPEERGLWIMNADGSGIKQLIKTNDVVALPWNSFEWSPNDRYVFYLAGKEIPTQGKFPDTTLVLKVISLDDGYVKELTTTDEFVAFSRWVSVTDIAYIDNNPYPNYNAQLKIVGVNGNKPVRQGNEVALVYADYRNNALDQGVIKSVTFGGVVKQLTPDTERAAFPVLSPDGKKVAYSSFGLGIMVMNIDGSGKVRVGSGENPSWSFDSSKIVYNLTKEDQYNITASDIYVVNADGSENRKVETEIEKGPALNPRWFPDGKHIVFEYDDKGVGTIEILPIE